MLRERDPRGVVGALQADLPALRPTELAAAIAAAGGRRAFCADRPGTGTTLLLAAPGDAAATRASAPGSAAAHAASGAVAVGAGLDSLRCDVDTATDLAIGRRARPRRQNSASCWADAEVHRAVRTGIAPSGRNCWTMRL